jgi:hypothetical protein
MFRINWMAEKYVALLIDRKDLLNGMRTQSDSESYMCHLPKFIIIW